MLVKGSNVISKRPNKPETPNFLQLELPPGDLWKKMQVHFSDPEATFLLFQIVFSDINIKNEKEKPTNSESFLLSHCYCMQS